MIRYIRLWPPPRCRAVMNPCLFRPPVFLSGSVRLFSGFLFLSVSSAKSLTDEFRRPGLVGLYMRMPIVDSFGFQLPVASCQLPVKTCLFQLGTENWQRGTQ